MTASVRFIFAFCCLAGVALALADAPTTEPATAPAGVDPALWQRMLAIDTRAGAIVDLSADFEQDKFTALLKHPLHSSGTVRVRGPILRWDTKQPEPTVMAADEETFRLYYPAQKLVEVYKLDQRLASLVASPLPRLGVLKEHFTFEQIPLADFPDPKHPDATDANRLAVRMKPTSDLLREHVDQVRVLLDVERGLIIRFELTDTDGDRTILTFDNIRVNGGLTDADVRLTVPPGTTITHPLGDFDGAAPPTTQRQQ